jgi:hypothetical protein
MYFVGLKRTTLTLCVIVIAAGFAINYYLQLKYQINPSVFNLVDYQFIDLTGSKPWNYLHPYFFGVLLSFFYYEFSQIKLHGNTNNHFIVVKVSEWIMNSYHAPSILFGSCLTCMFLFFYFHLYIMRDSKYDQNGEIVLDVSPQLIEKGALMTIFSTLSALIGMGLLCLLFFSERIYVLPAFLSNYVFRTITRTIFISSLFMPVFSRLYLGSFSGSIIISPNFSLYISFFGVIISVVFGIFFSILVDIPINDFLKLLWFKTQIEKQRIKKS